MESWDSCLEERLWWYKPKSPASVSCPEPKLTKIRLLQALLTEVGVNGDVTVQVDVRSGLFLKDSNKKRIRIPGELQLISGGLQLMLSIPVMLPAK
jgi:hypothetical protein